ncbi:phosphatase PAP2 family protein [Alsobacter sp. SYSU M60028]|uniref:Phosphatase PAP2 family protein n=1 Tax=Alsobacter ponti TaxID=2962936 RepID=A0ABT1L7D6_9HYPH|nr:phosphatase PAP2 family protein [Alsobacter ponti]MCP8937377.1 phosphatase PAP2 family protein [Alsobacter ponti]
MSIMAEVRSSAAALRGRLEEIAPLWLLLVGPVLLLAFMKLAVDVEEGDTKAFDRYVLLLFRRPGDPSTPIGPAWLQEMARDVTSLGSVAMLGFVFFAVLGYLVLARRRAAALLMMVAVGGGQVLSSVLKVSFERARPEIVPHAARVFTASFPSGHAMLSAVTYLTIGALLTRLLKNRRERIYVLSLAVLLTVLVGTSRVYLGVHWPTDVLAGWFVGASWALICWTMALWLQSRGKIENPARDSDRN